MKSPSKSQSSTMSFLPCHFLLLLLLLCFLAEAKHQLPLSAQTDARTRSVQSSGTLTTVDGHRCTWQTSGEDTVSLMVNCSTETQGHLQRYWCRYTGKPDLCWAYGRKSSQYWKQQVGKLKKRQNACEGEKVLKARRCEEAPAEAHLTLMQRSGHQDRKGGKRRAESAGNSANRKEEGFGEDGMGNDMEPVQRYCGEGWRSVCAFFITFFQD
ncbi:hypothetical protein LDENG_00231220 [Lucifuga dentata]|nr:hypothetical protein LDENG_00231220 [Lucifuga dentata]